jgi:hypothetical protein
MRALKKGEKVRLLFWMRDHPIDCHQKTADELAAMFNAETGENIGLHSILHYRSDVFPDMKREHIPGTPKKYTGGVQASRINAHDIRLATIEKRLDALEAKFR